MPKKPRTIEEKLRLRDAYSLHNGALKCKKKKTEIRKVGISTIKDGLSVVKYYKTPFTEAQAKEVCAIFGHVFVRK